MIYYARIQKREHVPNVEHGDKTMIIKRDILLNRLIKAKPHHLVKILTGMRRCGKSYLLFNLFKKHLLESGVDRDHIVEINLESRKYSSVRDAISLYEVVWNKLKNDRKMKYVLIDEIQLAKKALPKGIDIERIHPDDREDVFTTFYDVLNGLLNRDDVTTYVTGSNAKLLSTDVATVFRGRSEVIEVSPLSFAEFYPLRNKSLDFAQILKEYFLYGGLPECALIADEDGKRNYLDNLNSTIYLRDIADRYNLKNDELLASLTDTIMSSIGGLVNPNKIANTINTVSHLNANHAIVARYIGYLEDAFLVKRVRRYDVKGRRYLEQLFKCYATDTGIRNSRLGYRQVEPTHIMENVIYNELVRRGYSVDVGIMESRPRNGGVQQKVSNEIDFVVNKAPERVYIQSAFMIDGPEKRAQETKSLRLVKDGFRKIVITGEPYEKPWMNDDGITFMGLGPFLLDPHSIDTL